jgi:hypothetical protein
MLVGTIPKPKITDIIDVEGRCHPNNFLFYRDYQINSGTQCWTVMMNWL